MKLDCLKLFLLDFFSSKNEDIFLNQGMEILSYFYPIFFLQD